MKRGRIVRPCTHSVRRAPEAATPPLTTFITRPATIAPPPHRYVFSDGLPYTEPADGEWEYCREDGDRRFYSELVNGLRPAGKWFRVARNRHPCSSTLPFARPAPGRAALVVVARSA